MQSYQQFCAEQVTTLNPFGLRTMTIHEDRCQNTSQLIYRPYIHYIILYQFLSLNSYCELLLYTS